MNKIMESMFHNKTIKLIFLVAVTLVMRWVGVPWLNAFLYALFVTMGGGLMIFVISELTNRKNTSD